MNVTISGCEYFDLTNSSTWERMTIASVFGLIFLMIISASSIVIWKIYTLKRKTRASLLFAVLSISDLFVGLVSVVTIILNIFRFEGFLIYKLHCKVYRYLSYSPTSITWILSMFMALDRCFIVLYDIKYESRVTKRRLFHILIFLIAFSLFNSSMISLTDNYAYNQIIGGVFSAVVIILTIVAYIRLLWFVFYKQRQIITNKSSRTKTINRLTRSIMYVFIFQIGSILPTTVLAAINRANGSYENRVVENKWNYLARALVCSNSFFNSIIILRNGTFKKPVPKKTSSTKTQTFSQVSKAVSKIK